MRVRQNEQYASQKKLQGLRLFEAAGYEDAFAGAQWMLLPTQRERHECRQAALRHRAGEIELTARLAGSHELAQPRRPIGNEILLHEEGKLRQFDAIDDSMRAFFYDAGLVGSQPIVHVQAVNRD